MGKATIKDVSELTGLATGTISKYLNGGKLKEANRVKVEEAIEKLGYQVDEYARGLITHRTKTVGILLPELDNAFYAKIVSKIEENLNRSGYVAVVRDSRRDHARELLSIRWFISRRVDAIIMVPCANRASDYEVLKNASLPILFLDMFIEGLDFEYVIVDNCTVAQKGVEYLLDCGHRAISIVCAPQGVYTADRRLEGYRRALAERGIPFDERLVHRVEEDVDSAYHSIREIILRKECTALFASNLPSLYGALFAINELKLDIPGDISLLGFDDMMFTKIVRPRPTIIDQPVDQIAEVAGTRIVQLINQGGNYAYRKNCLTCTLNVGESVSQR